MRLEKAREARNWGTIGAGVRFPIPVFIYPRLPTDFGAIGQVGRSLGPLIFCSLYWWAGRDVAYAIGGVGMVGVCAVVFGALKAPVSSLATKAKPS